MTSEARILEFQNFMASSPMGISYSGPKDGKINPSLISSIKNLESKLQLATGKDIIGKIIAGTEITSSVNSVNKLIQSTISTNKIKPEISPHNVKTDNIGQENSLVLEFQNFFSNSQPIIGKLYSGAKDGKINPELISAARKTETIIAEKLNNNEPIGKIFSNKFNTNSADLLQALTILQKNLQT